MNRFILRLLPALALLAVSACSKQSSAPATTAAAATPPAAAAGAPGIKSTDQKVSYGIGYNMGAGLPKNGGLTVDKAALLAGIEDGLAGAKTRIPDAEIEAAFQEMQQKLVAARTAESAKQQAAGVEYCAKNKTKPGVTTTASGLQYEVLKSGSGPKPKPTDTVKVHYHGTLIDGTVFDSSVQRGEPVEFGVNEVIPGWTEALQLMSVGDKWKLTIPANIGYGAQGKGSIPPNAVLVFEVELLGIK